MDSFTLQGLIKGRPATVSWNDQDGFVADPDGVVAYAIQMATQVEGTPTGPFYAPASTPAVVALLTALSVFDGQTAEYDPGADTIQAALDDLTTLPPKAAG